VPGAGGIPLGIEIDLGAPSHEFPFGARDGVLLFTDGLPEARAADERREAVPRLGEDRVQELVRELGAAAPPAVIRTLRDAATAHAGGSFADDLCIVAARVKER
jgi:serine phosphatase RsbU (regulator of sigma subunit)